MIRYFDDKYDRIYQGDILKNIEYMEYIKESNGNVEISKIIFPYCIILTQDCDLEQDHNSRMNKKQNQDKYLISILVAPLYVADQVFLGEHLSNLKIKSQMITKDKTPGDYLQQNKNPRYHFLQFPNDFLNPMVIDFKHYFSVPINILNFQKIENYVCTVSELYREDICQRFASFLSRIGLPN